MGLLGRCLQTRSHFYGELGSGAIRVIGLAPTRESRSEEGEVKGSLSSGRD